MTPAKACTKCGEVKDLSEYPPHARCADGTENRCKACAAAATREWTKNNKDHNRVTKFVYAQIHRHKIQVQKRKWGAEHPEQQKASQQSYVERNRDKVRLAKQRSYQTYITEQRHRSRIKGAKRRMLLEDKGSFSLDDWNALVALYNFRCAWCASSIRKLTIDHIVPVSKGGDNYITNIQPLCKPCNSKKGARIGSRNL